MTQMFGFPGAADGLTPLSAPAPPPAPPSAPPPQAKPYQPSKFDIFMDMILNGRTPQEAAGHVRAIDIQNANQEYTLNALQAMPPAQREALLFGGADAQKNYGPQIVKPGERAQYFGPGGPAVEQATTGVSPGGVPYAMTSGGFQALAPQLPGTKTASNGLILDSNTGPTGQTYSEPQILPPGSTPSQFNPGGGQPAPAAPGAPRGIRNNNFGNVKTPPQGPWQGQVGVDDTGHAIFDTPENGVRAAAMNLQSYAKEGINTVQGVVSKWANEAKPAAMSHYVAYVAGALGVDPRAPIDLANPQTQQTMLRAMFQFENTPKAMNAWRKPGGQGGGWTVGQQVGTPSIVDPASAEAKGFTPGAVVERDAAGALSVKQAPEYGPGDKAKLREQVMGSEDYKMARSAISAYSAMIANADKMNGPSGYAILDTFARAINPGAVARPQVIETISKSLGVPNQVVGHWYNLIGQGKLTPEARQQIIDAVVPFAQSHWDQANQLNQANTSLARQHRIDPADVTAPLERRPERVGVAVPPAGNRPPGRYMTPKGPLRWDGKLWHQD